MFALLVLCAAVAAAAFLLCMPLSDPDLWWHLVAGRWMLAHKALPEKDLWNQFSGDTPWIAYSWSNELLYAAVEQQFGLAGLQWLQTGFGTLLAGSVAYVTYKLSRSAIASGGLTAAAALAFYPYFGLRPQVVSWILFLWLLFAAEMLRCAAPKSARSIYLSIFAIGVVWANSHITAALGIGALALWLLKSERSGLPWLTAPLAMFTGTLLTPNFGGEWLTFAAKSSHPFSHMFVREFQPGTITSFPTFAVIALCCALYLVLKNFAQDEARNSTDPFPATLPQLLTLTVFAMGALAVQKFIPYALLTVCVLLAKSLGTQSQSADAWLVALIPAQVTARRRLHPLAAAIVLLLAYGTYSYLPDRISPANAAIVDTRRVPEAAMEFIEANTLGSPLLHGFTDGGYVMFRRANAAGEVGDKVVIDGRTNVNNTAITAAYLDALAAKATWQKFVELTGASTVLWENRFPLTQILLNDPEWCHVFPPADVPLAEQQWSVFITREQFDSNFMRLTSRNCGAGR